VINPLHYYKWLGRPVGIWVAGVILFAAFVGHVATALCGIVSYPTAAVAVPLFILTAVALLRRRVAGMWLGIAFLILGTYTSVIVASQSERIGVWSVVLWWFVSLVGIFALISNRRWYDEKMINFPLS
jgi:predicted membrane channel-forming protein YqfA (hemolysin III family)